MKKNNSKTKNITFAMALVDNKYQESKYILKHLKAYNHGEQPDWNDLDKLFLMGFVTYLSSKICQNSVRTYTANIKSTMNKYSKLLTHTDFDLGQILSVKQTGTYNTYLTNSELQLLIDYVPLTEREHTIRNQFLLSSFTGMRHSDVIYLDENNLVQNEIIYFATKTKDAVRTVNCLLTTALIKEKMTKIYSVAYFNHTIREICKKAGINSQVKIIKAGKTVMGEKYKFISSHSARRSFATNLYEATKDRMMVSRMMGHSDVKMTQRYICNDNATSEKLTDYFNQFQPTAYAH